MKKIAKETKRWFEEKAKEYAVRSGGFEWMVNHKVEHTERVVRWGEKIIEGEKWPIEEEKEGLAACLLHDVGRFVQAASGTWSDKESTVNHAEAGARLLKESEKFGKNMIEAVKEHNNPFYDGNNMLVRLVRDADQMAIIEELEAQIKSHKKFWGDKIRISGRIREKYQNKEIVDRGETNSLGDWLVMMASWENNFNFEETKKLFKENGFQEKIQEKIRGLEMEDNFENESNNEN